MTFLISLALNWFDSHQYVALWLEGIALLAIFIWDRIDASHQHKQALAQMEIMRNQACATEAAANAATKSSESLINSERAWIIVSPIEKAPKIGYALDPSDPKDEDFGKDTINLFAAAFKNTGNTPAHLIESAVAYRQAERLEDIPQQPNYGAGKTFSNLLLVHGDSIGEVAYLSPGPLVSKSEAIKLRQRRLFWYAYGIVVYRDAFGRRHETRFGYVYHFSLGGDPRPDGFIRDGLPTAYNGAT